MPSLAGTAGSDAAKSGVLANDVFLQATVAGQVLDDDFGIHLVSTNLTQAEDGARFVFDVLRTGTTDEAMQVQWTLGNPVLANNESGVSANDFLNPATGQAFVDGNTPITGMLSFAAGQSTARFTVEAMHDATPEADERFSVQVAVTELGGVPLVAQPQQIDTVVGLITHDEVLPVNFDPAIDQQVHQPLPTLH
jgi:hypothetical protein